MASVDGLKNFGGAPSASLSDTAPAGQQRQAPLRGRTEQSDPRV